jgi:hypothetical protein
MPDVVCFRVPPPSDADASSVQPIWPATACQRGWLHAGGS